MKNIKTFEQFNINDDVNESLMTSAIKGYVKISQLIKNFKKLFNKIDRTELFKEMKISDSLIDFIFFIRDSKWFYDDNLDREFIKKLAKSYNIDKKYPYPIDILNAQYEKKFKKNFKEELNKMYDYLTDEKSTNQLIEKGDVNKISMLKQLTDLVKEFKNILD